MVYVVGIVQRNAATVDVLLNSTVPADCPQIGEVGNRQEQGN